MTNTGKIRRSWDVSPTTADLLNKLQLISGLEKSELVDIAINLLYQTTLTVRDVSGHPSKDIIEAIAMLFPSDLRSAIMELDSTVPRLDPSKLLSLLSGDDKMTLHSISDSNVGRLMADSDEGGNR